MICCKAAFIPARLNGGETIAGCDQYPPSKERLQNLAVHRSA
jgi:hypothetical protein